MPKYVVKADYTGRNGKRTKAGRTVELTKKEGDRLVDNGWGVPAGQALPADKVIHTGNTRTEPPTTDGLSVDGTTDEADGQGDLEL